MWGGGGSDASEAEKFHRDPKSDPLNVIIRRVNMILWAKGSH